MKGWMKSMCSECIEYWTAVIENYSRNVDKDGKDIINAADF